MQKAGAPSGECIVDLSARNVPQALSLKVQTRLLHAINQAGVVPGRTGNVPCELLCAFARTRLMLLQRLLLILVGYHNFEAQASML